LTWYRLLAFVPKPMKIKGLYRMPGSRFYWYRWSQGGKRIAVSLKTDDLATALRAIERIKDGEWIARWERAEAVATPAIKVVEDYLKKAQERAKKPMRRRTAGKKKAVLLKFLKDTGVSSTWQINQGNIEGWLEGLKEDGASSDTIHTYARDLHTFAAYLVERKLAAADLANFDIPERGATGRKNWVKTEEVNRIISQSRDRDLTFALYCGFHAGLRRSEIDNARVHWFDLEAGLLHVENEPDAGFKLKDRENRTIKLTRHFREFLRGYLTGGPQDFAMRPRKAAGKNDYRYDFSTAWESHMKRCGVRCTIHDARRSFASNLVSAGQSIYIVAKWLGDGVQVVERSYGHLAPSAGDVDVLSSIPSAAISPSIFSATRG
jgi:integrase